MNKKIILIWTIVIGTCLIFNAPVSLAALDPNYGTTTFFSEKAEKPSANPPIYDTGTGRTKKTSNNNADPDSESGSLFNQLFTEVGDFFGVTNVASDSTETSLFDLQSDSADGNSSDSSSDEDGEFIMGAKGESQENTETVQAEKNKSRFALNFNFREDSINLGPGKSRLIFTNIIIPIDMTTQYILIGFVFFIALSGTVGYYFWKKESAKLNVKIDEEYD